METLFSFTKLASLFLDMFYIKSWNYGTIQQNGSISRPCLRLNISQN